MSFISLLGKIYRETYVKYVYNKPNSSYRKNLVYMQRDLQQFQGHCDQLCDYGYLALPNYVENSVLQSMKKDFEAIIANREYDERNFLSLGGHLLVKSYSLSMLSVDPYLTSIVKYYYGKKIYLAQNSGYSSLNFESQGYGAFQWHHDAKGKQVKIFVLLTDVGENGQHTDLIPETHKISHSDATTYEDTRYSETEASTLIDKYGLVHFTGKAGTVFIFDTNSLHRGNRNGPRRDVWVFNYTAGRSLMGETQVNKEALEELTIEQRSILRS